MTGRLKVPTWPLRAAEGGGWGGDAQFLSVGFRAKASIPPHLHCHNREGRQGGLPKSPTPPTSSSWSPPIPNAKREGRSLRGESTHTAQHKEQEKVTGHSGSWRVSPPTRGSKAETAGARFSFPSCHQLQEGPDSSGALWGSAYHLLCHPRHPDRVRGAEPAQCTV